MENSCHACGRSGVKLWRKSHGYPEKGDLLCSKHLKKYEWPPSDCRKHNGVSFVPAVIMTGEEDTDGKVMYWGYTSVPEDAAKEWYTLEE